MASIQLISSKPPISPYTDIIKINFAKNRKLYGTRRAVAPHPTWVSSATNTRKNLLTAGSNRHNSNRAVYESLDTRQTRLYALHYKQ
jgi:hypothetical protein